MVRSAKTKFNQNPFSSFGDETHGRSHTTSTYMSSLRAKMA